MKEFILNKPAMDKMLIGLDLAADIIGGTLGPKGKNVYLNDAGIPEIINDGATIASRIVLDDKQEDAGAYVLRNVSSQQNDDVGDGTTTAPILTHAIIHECLTRPENAMEIKESLKKAGDRLLKILAKKSVKITKKDIEKVALISAENPKLAKLITEIIEKLGNKAVIGVEDSKTFDTDYEIVSGYEAQTGFMSPHFINDKSGKVIYVDVPVLVSEKKISNVIDLKPILDQFQQKGITSCVIVCDDIETSILGMLVVNKKAGIFNFLVVKASGDVLKDIEGATGATAVSASTGVNFQNLKIEHLGKAKKVVCDANKTLFLGDGVASKIYAEQIEKQVDNEPNMYLKKKLEERVARLKGGIAILRVGASTDFERDYLRRKAEDAVKATLAALEEGVVEGGGMALWRIAKELKPKTIGEEILKKALSAPLRKIIENAGKDYTEILIDMPQGQGYDAKNDCYANLMECGIIDPSKVERCALENSVSAASIFITTKALITEKENGK